MHLSTALPINRLGVIAWWSASVVEADPAELRDSFDLEAPQFAEHVRQPASPHAALRRARRRSQSGTADGYEWQEVGTSGSHLVVALVREHRDAVERSYSAAHRWLVQVCDKTGTFELLSGDGRTPLDVTSLPAEEVTELERLRSRYRKERALLTYEDLHLILAKILAAAKSIRVKEGGAVYFVPREHDHILDAVKPCLAIAGINVRRVPVLDGDAETVAAIAEPAKASLLEEAADLRAKIETWSEKACSGGRIKRTTATTALSEIAELRAKADVYRRLLSLGLGDVDAALAASEQALNRVAVALSEEM